MKMKKILLSLSLVLVLALGSVAVFAADPQPVVKVQSNVEILAEILKVEPSVIIEKLKAGESLSEQAVAADKFDEFVAEIKEAKIAFGLGQGRVNGGQGLGQANGEAAGLGQGYGPANGGRGMMRGGMMGQGFGQGMMGQGYNAVTPAN